MVLLVHNDNSAGAQKGQPVCAEHKHTTKPVPRVGAQQQKDPGGACPSVLLSKSKALEQLIALMCNIFSNFFCCIFLALGVYL